MADSNVPITPGTGANVDTFTQASGDHRQAVVIGDATNAYTQRVNAGGDAVMSLSSPNGVAAGLFATMSAYGYQRVTTEPGIVFFDPFDGTSIDSNRWNPVGTVSQASGGLLLGNTTVSTVHSSTSVPAFAPQGLNFTAVGFVLTLEASPLTTNQARFFGTGWHSGTPTASVPVTDGIGFEFPGDGTLRAAVYQSGVRSASSVTITASATAGPTRYGLIMRSDLAIFYIGTTEVPVATVSFVPPDVQTLPLKLQVVNGASVTGTPSTKVTAIGVHDTGSNATLLADATYPWRRAKVDTTGNLAVFAPDVYSSGTISATDAVVAAPAGTGALLSGTPTANSYVALACGSGESGFLAQLTGTFGGGTAWFECSVDSTNGANGNWSTLSVRVLGTTGSSLSDSTAVAGLYRGNASGVVYLRIRLVGATSPSVAVVLRGSDGQGPVALNAPIPAGTATIGRTTATPSATGTITSVALVTSSFTALASNTARLAATFYNDSVNTIYLALASAASTTVYTVQVPSNGYYELPGANVVYTGIVTAISAVASGNLRVTELT